MSFRGRIDDERGGLLAELTEGFEALMQKADELVNANHRLEERLHALQVEVRSYPNKTALCPT
jgi:chaperonin cofactor prefoldin